MRPHELTEKLAFFVVGAVSLSLLLIPIALILVTSFTPSSFPTIPRGELSLQWYAALLNNDTLLQALVTSFVVATAASMLSATIGAITAFGFVRSEFPYKEGLATTMLLPLMISPVITGLALIRYTNEIGIGSGYPTLIVGHAVLTLPYTFLIIRSRLLTFDQQLESASRVMGADPVETAFNVTLPVISPTVVSAVLVAFVVSFGEFTATQFLISPDTTTVPVIIYTMLRAGLSPEISALSMLLVVLMVLGAVGSKAIAD